MFKEELKLTCQCLTIFVEGNILKEIQNYQKYGAFELESGGIIAGYYDVHNNALRVTDITWPQSDDICKQFQFIRKEKDHQEIMDKLWTESEHMKSYLGEWHTHNQCRPSPSFVDRNNWKKISKKAHNFKDLLFIIVGKKYTGIWIVNNQKILKLGEWNNEKII